MNIHVDLSELLPPIPEEALVDFLKESANNAMFDNYLTCLRCEKSVLLPIEEVQAFVDYALSKDIIVSGGAFVFQASSVTKQYLYI